MRTFLLPRLPLPRPSSPSVKDLHYEVCQQEGMTDEEIAQDWAQVEKDLQAQFLQMVDGTPPEEPR